MNQMFNSSFNVFWYIFGQHANTSKTESIYYKHLTGPNCTQCYVLNETRCSFVKLAEELAQVIISLSNVSAYLIYSQNESGTILVNAITIPRPWSPNNPWKSFDFELSVIYY